MFKGWLGEKVARDFCLYRKHCSIPHISFSISPIFRSRLDHPNNNIVFEKKNDFSRRIREIETDDSLTNSESLELVTM